MAPITCLILDSLGQPLPGTRVTLRCQHPSLYMSTFESITDADGGISMWFPVESPCSSGLLQPRFLDTALLHMVSLSFSVRWCPKTAFPTRLIHADLLHLSDVYPAVIVQVAQTPLVQYVLSSSPGPHSQSSTMEDNVDEMAMSPFRLPSPILVQTCHGRAACSSTTKTAGKRCLGSAPEEQRKKTRLAPDAEVGAGSPGVFPAQCGRSL